jgi:hypothetical protein
MNNFFYIRKVLFFLSLMFLASSSYASLRVVPAVVNIFADKNSICENKYIVTNPEDRAVTIEVGKEDWKNFSGNPSDVSVDRWLNIKKTTLDIGPGESVEVPFEVVADDNMVGSVSGMIVFSAREGMMNFVMKLPIYIVIRGTEQIDFSIDSLNIGKSDRDGKIYYAMNVKNDGNVHIRHGGFIEIYDNKKKDVIKIVRIEETYPVYAQESKVFHGVVAENGELKKGKYLAVFKIRAFDREIKKKIKFKVSKTGEVVAQ